VRILFDTNVVLDVLLGREPHVEVAARLLTLVDHGRIEGLLCATTVTTIHYIASRGLGMQRSDALVRELLELFDVATVDERVIERALDCGFGDFEDAVLHEAAVGSGVAAIVTRNSGDFDKAVLPVFEPGELLAAVIAASE